MIRRIYLIGLLFALLSGCISIQSNRNADPYVIHHHTWWNYYQRGRLYLKAEKFEEAQQDFETAMGRIPGARTPYAKERWRARIYGMHMLEGYFPHRELGICLFEQDQLTKALGLLETSMQMEPSARAKFYINRIHQRLAVAAAPPRIEIATLPRWTAQRTQPLQGVIRGSNAITALTINGNPEFIELATPRIDFQRELPLQEGSNVIRLIAKDIAGRQTVTNLIIMADWTPPQMHLSRSGTTLSITCFDNLGLHQIQINNRTISPTENEYTVPIPLNASEPLKVAATDRSGNRIDWVLSQAELRHLAQNQLASPPKLRIANNGKTITLCTPEYALDIHAEDDTALRSLELNGEPLLARDTPLFRTLRRVPLSLGTNQLVLTAIDSEGNRTEKKTTVIYRRPEYLDQIYRLATTQSPLAGEIPNPVFERRANLLIGHELTRDPVRFYLLADPKESQQLQREQRLAGSDLADPRALLKQGKKLNTDLTFITRVLSDGPGQTVYTQVLDTDSGEELFIEDIYLEDSRNLQQQIGGLIMKIEQRFPLIQASIHKQNQTLVIDAGEKSGAYKGMRFLTIRSEGSFEQGHVIHDGKRPAELIISKVESKSAQVIIPRRQTKDSIQPGDYVFSR